MRKFRRLSVFIAVFMALSLCWQLTSLAAVNVLNDNRQYWRFGNEYGGTIKWQSDGSLFIGGKSGIATYTKKRMLDQEVTVRFKASLENEWAALFIRNDVDDTYLSDEGIQAFHWKGRGNPFMIGITKDRIGLSQCYTDSPDPKSLTSSPVGNISDGKEHAISVKVTDTDSETMNVVVKLDGAEVINKDVIAQDNAPMKKAGYLSIACYNTSDSITVTGIDFPDGFVALTAPTDSSAKPAASTPASTKPATSASSTNGSGSNAAVSTAPSASIAENSTNPSAQSASESEASTENKGGGALTVVLIVVIIVLALAVIGMALYFLWFQKRKNKVS